MMVFISNRKLHVSAYSGHRQVLTTFLVKELYDGRYRPKHVVFYPYCCTVHFVESLQLSNRLMHLHKISH